VNPHDCESRRRSGPGRTLATFLLLGAALGGAPDPVPAAPPPSSEEAVLAWEETVANRLRPACQAILITLKSIEDRAPARPDVAATTAIREELGAVRGLVERYREHSEASEGLRGRAEGALASARAAGRDVGDLERRAADASKAADKYRRYVEKFWGRAVDRWGEPIDPGPGAGLPAGGPGRSAGMRVSGSLSAALGGSSYELVNADTDESVSEIQGRVEARGRLRSGTLLDVRLGRESRVERREITLTEAGVTARHELPGGFGLEGGLSRTGYDEELVSRASYGETKLLGGIHRRFAGGRLAARVERRGRSHEDDDSFAAGERLDYSVTTMRLEGEVRLGAGGRLRGSAARTLRDGENDFTDQDLDAVDLGWQGSAGGPELQLAFQRFRYPDVEDFEVSPGAFASVERDSLENQRIKARLVLPGRGGARRVRWTPEVLYYRFPEQDDAGWIDVGIERSARGSGRGGTSSSRLRAAYRRHEDEADTRFDFATLTLRDRRRPVRGGFARELGASVKWFVESADVDSIGEVEPGAVAAADVYVALGEITSALQSTREPNVVDLYFRGGWRVPGKGGLLEAVEAGPIVGHLLFADTEQKKLMDKAEELFSDHAGLLPPEATNPFEDRNPLWKNSLNRFRAGGYGAVDIRTPTGFALRVSVEHTREILYNADPGQTFTSTDLAGSGRYFLRRDLVLEAVYGLHRVRFGDDSPNDYDRTEVRAGVRWLFDLDASELFDRRRSR
jgi:hypothetical protein